MRRERPLPATPPAALGALLATRLPHGLRLGERVRWLPPHGLVPSFASADGQPIVYRRRSQVVLTPDSDNSAIVAATSFALGSRADLRIRIDEYGYAHLVRSGRAAGADPVTALAESGNFAGREAAQQVCDHLNRHVDAIATPQRWTPAPNLQLVPVGTAFVEPPPQPPQPGVTGGRRAAAPLPPGAVDEYLDARAQWLRRRFAWEEKQRTARERSAGAAAGDPAAMQAHFAACLEDVLWPAPVLVSYGFDGPAAIAIDVRVPGPETLPEREAGITYGNRVAVKPMPDVKRSLLHNRHALGLVVRMIGEAYAALPTVERCTVHAYEEPLRRDPRFVVAARADRSAWSMLYVERRVTDDPADRTLRALDARFRLNGLGAFLAVEPLA